MSTTTEGRDRPLVAVLVGTDHHRFDRLVSWCLDLADRLGPVDWFLQHGTTPVPALRPAHVDAAAYLRAPDLDELLATASCVVTHAGPGLVMEARALGHVPVVVARDPGHAEHVDDHQLRFVGRLVATGLVARADDASALETCVRAALASGRRPVGQEDAGTQAAHRLRLLVDQLVPQG